MTQDPLPGDEWADDPQLAAHRILHDLPPEVAAALAELLAPPPKAPPPLQFPTLPTFIDEWLLPTWRRDIDGNGRERTWCPDWWKHPEAVFTLEQLWRSFEHLRHDGGLGLSVWLRDHLRPHMAELIDPHGPLQGCTIEGGHDDRLQRLPTNPPPDGLFDD